MAGLFDPLEVGGLRLANRAVRSATYENRCDAEGRVTDALLEFYRPLAEGGLGLVVTGNAMVHPWGRTAPNALGIYSDEHLPGLERLARVFADRGVPAVVQLSHGGRQSLPDLLEGREIPAPSAVYSRAMKRTPREMTRAEIKEAIEAFVAAAERAWKAGFAGVQLHAAHGYLLSNFLSPLFNVREDGWGGSTRARTRILVEIAERIHARCGKEFPVLVKLNTEEGLPGGLDVDEACRVVRALPPGAFAAVEASGGIYETGLACRPGIASPRQEAYFLPNAERIAEASPIPVILVGGLRSLERIQEILAAGRVQAVAMSRPLIREPGLVRRWREGDRRRARCISCNECMTRVFEGPVRCYQEEREARARSGRAGGEAG